MSGNVLYIKISENSVLGALKIHPNNAYIESVIENMKLLTDWIPKENMLEFSYEETDRRLLENGWAKERLKGCNGVLLFGGFYSEDRWQNDWDVNIVRDELERTATT